MKTIASRISPNLFQPSWKDSSSWVTKVFSADLTHFWMKGIKIVLSLLIITILLGLTGGVLRIFLNLQALFSHPIEQALRHLIVDTLIILAIVEVFKTTLIYFSEGRVKVTFIVDTILVVMLTEIISKWFSEAPVSQWMTLGGILMVLGIIRIVTVQWSPTRAEPLPDIGSIANLVEHSSQSHELVIPAEAGIQNTGSLWQRNRQSVHTSHDGGFSDKETQMHAFLESLEPSSSRLAPNVHALDPCFHRDDGERSGYPCQQEPPLSGIISPTPIHIHSTKIAIDPGYSRPYLIAGSGKQPSVLPKILALKVSAPPHSCPDFFSSISLDVQSNKINSKPNPGMSSWQPIRDFFLKC